MRRPHSPVCDPRSAARSVRPSPSRFPGVKLRDDSRVRQTLNDHVASERTHEFSSRLKLGQHGREARAHFGAESLEAVDGADHHFEIGDEAIGVELNEVDAL